MRKEFKLSVVILNYNTKDLLLSCLGSLAKVQTELNFEIIVVDNGSVDGSIDAIKSYFINHQSLIISYKLIVNQRNLGFAAGNNRAKRVCRGEYVLFLNSDTEVRKNVLRECVNYFDVNEKVGALSCKLVLPNGKLDPDCRRSFPTPWVAFTHFSGLDKLFPQSKFLARYWYGFLDENVIHEVDSIQGAFFLTRKNILDKVGWFDEDYFIDGEDIDLCFKIREAGYKIIYFPKVAMLHIKKASKKKTKEKRNVIEGVKSMELFYKKHLWWKYPAIVNYWVITGIWFMKTLRLLRSRLR